MRKMIQRAKNQKGFTLVELMVVVVIIGILVAVAIPVFGSVQENAANKAHNSNVRILHGAAVMWMAENPGEAKELTINELGDYLDGTAFPVVPKAMTGYSDTDVYVVEVTNTSGVYNVDVTPAMVE